MKTLAGMTILTALMLGLCGCQRDADEMISVNGKVFIFNIRLSSAYYALTLNRLPTAPDGGEVTVEFENPAGGADLVSRQKVFAGMKRIDLQSPELTCVVADRPYRIRITLASPDGAVLQTLETTLTSTLDQTVMPEAALVRGNGYDRNPQAYDKDGRILFRKACKTAA